MAFPVRPIRSLAALCLHLGLLSTPASHATAVDAAWVTPVRPFQIADNLYYVGSQDLAAYLVTTPQGDILINSNYTSSPPQIRRSVEALGFRWRDIKILLISHAHVDHAGGSAEIVRETGARLEVMQGDVDVMETGGRTDFAFGGPHKALQFPPVHVDRTLQDGEQVSLGGATLTAHRTAGHTRGCTTWTMEAHLPGDPAGRLRHVVIVGSWSVLSSYHLVPTRNGNAASYPGIADDYARTFATLQKLPCDVFLGSHGSFFGMLAKQQRLPAEGDSVWIDPHGYQEAVKQGQQAFEATYQRQAAAAGQGVSR